jgi:hypothetical protein
MASNHARLFFKYFNLKQGGAKTLIFDDWGSSEKETVSVGPNLQMHDSGVAVIESSQTNYLIISTPKNYYLINLTKGTGENRQS